MTPVEVAAIELDLLLEGMYRRYGVDLRNYSKASLRRRIQIYMEKKDVDCYSDLIPLLLKDKDAFDMFMLTISVGITEMFRDPPFFIAFRKQIIPILKTYPFVKIWHAGCSTGEEVYSLAIILHEEQFLERSIIYATDFNSLSLDVAKKGIYSSDALESFNKNYLETAPKSSFRNYCQEKYGYFKLHDFLQKNIVFSTHNLATDGVFGEMNVIICRNVLIYFDKSLQERVFTLFTDSLSPLGFLCLGSKETIKFSELAPQYEVSFKQEKIFRKITGSNGN
ncbi:MAG: protein-glutamate O-methyltransferase CheR [Candidatus Nitrohelix vancouverensis]|uniref:Protein-glutamate O-methyltransferase CheR n=1 Tax=Candidatus Nitrohelix vancouverensis TaxID=2705534 RepID=A0A7T0C1J0_9BACT|nr:MAG: protein-glutamate O-methyltransferase CheR [Candidatus Nitrohelix vancouverensis]